MYLLTSPILHLTKLDIIGVATGPNPKAVLLHKHYSGSGCEGDVAFTYKTPFGRCFGDAEYYDCFDEILDWDRHGKPTDYRHTCFYSKNSSCLDRIETFGIEGSIEFCTSWGDVSEKQLVVFH